MSLTALQQPLQNFPISRDGVDGMGILSACLQEVTSLGEGTFYPMKKEQIDFKAVLDSLLLLFAEKIHQLAVEVNCHIQPDLPSFFADPLTIEALLIDAIGKPICRVPQNGVVSINLKETSGLLVLEIQDNGFAGIEAAEKLIRESFDFFMDEDVFAQACAKNGVQHQCSKTHDGLNVTRLILPTTFPEGIKANNVVQLFS